MLLLWRHPQYPHTVPHSFTLTYTHLPPLSCPPPSPPPPPPPPPFPRHPAQVEKVTHATATELLKDFGSLDKVGTSLGSFSVGSTFLALLMGEFKGELDAKEGKLDADPHFWMPMTLDKANYIKGKGTRNAEREEGEEIGWGGGRRWVCERCRFWVVCIHSFVSFSPVVRRGRSASFSVFRTFSQSSKSPTPTPVPSTFSYHPPSLTHTHPPSHVVCRGCCMCRVYVMVNSDGIQRHCRGRLRRPFRPHRGHADPSTGSRRGREPPFVRCRGRRQQRVLVGLRAGTTIYRPYMW